MRFNPGGDVDFQLDNILNRGIEFDDNVRGGFVEFVTEEGEQEVIHNLGWTPIGYLLIYKDADINLWVVKPQSWDQQSMFFQSSAPNATVRIFVM